MASGPGLSESEIHSSEHTRRWSRRDPWCPAQWGHFIVDHGRILLVLKGEEKHFDRPMKNLFEMSCGVEKICVLFKKLQGKPSEGAQIGVYTTVPPAWPECFINTYTNPYWRWSVLYPQNLLVLVFLFYFSLALNCQFDSTNHFWQCVHIAGANCTDSMVSRCAQQFVWKHGTKWETPNMREHQRKWFRLTTEFSAWFLWRQAVTVLREYR